MAMNFDKPAEELYGSDDRASDRAQTIRTQNFDFFLPKPDSQKASDKIINSRAQKIVFLSHGFPLLFWKVGQKDQEIELVSRDSKILSSFFPHYNKEGAPDPLGANKKNQKPFWNWVFPIMHLTDGYIPEGQTEFVETPKIKFWRCSDARANDIFFMRIRLLKEIYKKAEAAVTNDPTKRGEWLQKGYVTLSELENKVANKSWDDVEAMPDIPKELKAKASLVGMMAGDQMAYNTYVVQRTGTGNTTKYNLDLPVLMTYNWNAKKSVNSKQNPGTMVDVDVYKRPDYRGCYGKCIPGSLAEQLFMGGVSTINTEVEGPNLYKQGECDALAMFVYANVAKSVYAPYEGYVGSNSQNQNTMNQAPAAAPVAVPADDLF